MVVHQQQQVKVFKSNTLDLYFKKNAHTHTHTLPTTEERFLFYFQGIWMPHFYLIAPEGTISK